MEVMEHQRNETTEQLAMELMVFVRPSVPSLHRPSHSLSVLVAGGGLRMGQAIFG